MVFSQQGEIDRDLRVTYEERLLKINANGFIEQVLVNKRTYFVPIFSQNDLHVIQDRWIFSDDPSNQQYLHNFEVKIIPAFSQLNPILLLPLFFVTTKIYITRNRTFQPLLWVSCHIPGSAQIRWYFLMEFELPLHFLRF